jgi:hypothetical protein
MFRALSIASSFFAASFIVLTFLGLLAWGGSAAFADQPLTGSGFCSGCGDEVGNPCTGGDPCDGLCICTCDPNCNCHFNTC